MPTEKSWGIALNAAMRPYSIEKYLDVMRSEPCGHRKRSSCPPSPTGLGASLCSLTECPLAALSFVATFRAASVAARALPSHHRLPPCLRLPLSHGSLPRLPLVWVLVLSCLPWFSAVVPLACLPAFDAFRQAVALSGFSFEWPHTCILGCLPPDVFPRRFPALRLSIAARQHFRDLSFFRHEFLQVRGPAVGVHTSPESRS